MSATKLDSHLIAISIWLYRNLLLVYPSSFHRQYGSQMTQVFGDFARARFQQDGVSGLLTWWGWTMLDTVKTAIEEHSQRGVDMSKEKFEKLSGWALLLAGPVFFTGWLAGTRPDYEPHNYFSVWIDQYANAITMPLMVIGILLLVVGFSGLLVRYGAASGGFGKFGLAVGSTAGFISAAGAFGMVFLEDEFWWILFFWGLMFQFGGLLVFGLVCLRKRILPQWNGLPLLAGIWIPAFGVASAVYEAVTGKWLDWPDFVFTGIMFASLIGLVGIGIILQRENKTGTAIPMIPS